MKKIDLMIIGAQKAGTTSLKQYLGEHPSITTHHEMEFDYFLSDERFEAGYDAAFKLYFEGVDSQSQQKLVAKCAGLYSSEQAIKRLYEHNPDCQLVYLVREPVSRAYSSYSMEKTNGWMKNEFDDIIQVIEKKQHQDSMYRLFIKLGLYSDHLKNVYKYFPRAAVKVFLCEEMKTNAEEICKETFAWMGVDDTFVPNCGKKYNESFKPKSEQLSSAHLQLQKSGVSGIAKRILPARVYKKIVLGLREGIKSEERYEPMSPQAKEYLQAFFAPYNAELEELSDVNLDAWKR